MTSKVLILPSWYATPSAPTSGSFFREQAELMMPEFDVKVLVSDKRWISWRRYYFEKFFRRHNRVLDNYFINTPPTHYFEYDFIKSFDDSKNFEIQLQNYEQILEKLITQGWKPDLLHAHCTFMGGIIAAHLSKVFDIPYCITEHMGPFVLHHYSAFWKELIVRSLQDSAVVLAVSNHQKQHILMNEIDCNILVVGNLVNEALFSINNKYPVIFTILFVAYYPNFIKDVDTFFAAISLLKTENIRVKIIGGGEISGTLGNNVFLQKAKDHDVLELVEIIPKASREEMNNHFADSHVLVSSSIAESFGVVICEAMLCGRPVVTTKNGGCDDYMQEGVNGFVVSIRDPEALAEKIALVKTTYSAFNPHEIRNKIVQNYGKQTFKDTITEIYQQIIQQ